MLPVMFTYRPALALFPRRVLEHLLLHLPGANFVR